MRIADGAVTFLASSAAWAAASVPAVAGDAKAVGAGKKQQLSTAQARRAQIKGARAGTAGLYDKGHASLRLLFQESIFCGMPGYTG